MSNTHALSEGKNKKGDKMVNEYRNSQDLEKRLKEIENERMNTYWNSDLTYLNIEEDLLARELNARLMDEAPEEDKDPITELKELLDRNDRLEERLEIQHRTGWSRSNGIEKFHHHTTIGGHRVSGEGKTAQEAESKAAAKTLEYITYLKPYGVIYPWP
jgi:CRISPR/Cas system-associated exonuclease Cas4 (RecB family)